MRVVLVDSGCEETAPVEFRLNQTENSQLRTAADANANEKPQGDHPEVIWRARAEYAEVEDPTE